MIPCPYQSLPDSHEGPSHEHINVNDDMSTLSGFPSINGVATLLPPPEGYKVNFNNPQRQYETEMYSVAAVGNLLMLLFLSQRLYTKIFLTKGLQLDDDTFIAGNQGVHAWELPVEEYEKFRLIVYISAPVFVPCGSFAKIALLVFYLRLSPQRWFSVAIWTTVGIIAIYSPVITFSLLFACHPVRKAYSVIEAVDGTCLTLPALYIAVAICNIVTDVILFTLPLPMVYSLNMPKAQKWGVVLVFGIGSITVITSVIRASILPSLFNNPDQSWVTAPASFWVDREEEELEFQILSQMGAKKHNSSDGGSNTVSSQFSALAPSGASRSPTLTSITSGRHLSCQNTVAPQRGQNSRSTPGVLSYDFSIPSGRVEKPSGRLTAPSAAVSDPEAGT
ncbi:putative integral membrane protein [Eutypa lata UCREL1]|uniref:Putative integral membrane protein n=1 Tax=Eutypa lata (strain UCR-EL1) TaxID=1287681 RepID=M7TFD6_EUTLA|nr:putative integral membrane protein [Eutypa lata UCREL1]